MTLLDTRYDEQYLPTVHRHADIAPMAARMRSEIAAAEGVDESQVRLNEVELGEDETLLVDFVILPDDGGDE